MKLKQIYFLDLLIPWRYPILSYFIVIGYRQFILFILSVFILSVNRDLSLEYSMT